MSYSPLTDAETLDLVDGCLTPTGQILGADRIRSLFHEGQILVVDASDLREARTSSGIDGDYSRKQLASRGVDVASEWTTLAVVGRDESYFDSYDGKWEYCYTDYAVIARTSVVETEVAATTAPKSWDLAAKAGFGDYAN